MKSLSGGEWTCILVGSAIVAAALFWAWRMYYPWRAAIHTEGVVTAILTEEDEDGFLYGATVSYKSQFGDSLEFNSSTRYSTPHFTVGEKVDVIYLPSNRAMINLFGERWLGPLFVAGLGLGVLGLMYFIIRIKVEPDSSSK